MSYEEFKEFHGKHPNMDNAEYYAEFPETNKSTIRSWKTRIRKPIETPLPTETEATKLSSSWEDEMIKLLCTQTNTPFDEFEGIDNTSALMVLKARLKNSQLQEPEKKKGTPNSPILPTPKSIGQNTKKFGIDQYIEFDGLDEGKLNEIRMEIPMSKLMNPKENEEIRGRTK